MATQKHTTIDEYIHTFPIPVQEILQQIRAIIRKKAPDAVETISYQIPTFKLNGKYLVYFAGWKDHVSLYPLPHGNDAFRQEIAPYITGKGTAQFSLAKPIPYDIIEKIVAQHLAERTPPESK